MDTPTVGKPTSLKQVRLLGQQQIFFPIFQNQFSCNVYYSEYSSAQLCVCKTRKAHEHNHLQIPGIPVLRQNCHFLLISSIWSLVDLHSVPSGVLQRSFLGAKTEAVSWHTFLSLVTPTYNHDLKQKKRDILEENKAAICVKCSVPLVQIP